MCIVIFLEFYTRIIIKTRGKSFYMVYFIRHINRTCPNLMKRKLRLMHFFLFPVLQTKLEKLNLSSQIDFDASDDDDIDMSPIESLSSPEANKGPTVTTRKNDDSLLRLEENGANNVVRNGRPPLVGDNFVYFKGETIKVVSPCFFLISWAIYKDYY